MSNKHTKQAFERFYLDHIDKVYRFVFFRVNCDKELAQDLVSEIFMKALKNFADYDEAVSKSAWLMTIAKNHVINYYRDTKPVADLPQDEDGEVLDSFWLISAKNVFKKNENARFVQEFLDELDESSREIVTFHYIYGYSYAEIAEMKQMTESAVKVAAHRAVKKMSSRI